jgi:hypothetical protein
MPDATPNTAPTAQLPSASPSEEHYLELLPPRKVKVGAKYEEAIAVQIKVEDGKEIQRYLVGTPSSSFV